MKITVFGATALFLLISTGAKSNGIPRNTRQKLHHKYRPEKETALWEKPLISKDEVTTDDSGTEQDAEQGSTFPFDFDWNSLFNSGTRGTTRIRNLFSEVWSDLFQGNKNATDTGSSQGSTGGTGAEEAFFSGIFDLMKPWWKGENVCIREEETEEERTQDNFVSSLVTSCQDVGNVYTCTMKIGKDGKLTVRTLIYECCHGWTRSAGGKGCTERLELTDMTTALRQMNLTRFIETMESIGLNAKLSDSNFTVFVPTNEALSTVTDSEEISFVLLETGDKMQFVKEILLGHMLPGWQYSYEWADEMTLPTERTGSSVRINFFSYPQPFATVNCARILSADKQTLGGLIHTVDRVIMPARQTLYEILGQDTRFSTFTSLIDEELREKLLDTDQHLTVLAFTDEEFEKLPSHQQATIRNKENCFSSKRHKKEERVKIRTVFNFSSEYVEQVVFPHAICSSAVQSDAVVRNLAGGLVKASRNEEDGSEEVYFGGVKVGVADRIATNGIIHVMSGVILLQNMVDAIEVAERNSGEVFAELLRENGELPSSVTLFVPPNEALINASLGQSQETKADLLKNHILDRLVLISRSNPETIVRTEAGNELSVKVHPSRWFFLSRRNSMKATVGCARILKANVKSCDGMVHFIDRVIAIPRQSTLELLRANEDVSEFVSLIEIAGLDSELNRGNFTGTVLAPSNTALEEHLTSEEKEMLINRPEKLKAFLRQHILTESMCCQEFSSVWWFEPNRLRTMAGTYIFSSGSGQNLRIGGAFVGSCDNLATNGIVHIIDRPIIRRRVSSIPDMFSRASRNNHPNSFNWNVDWPF